MVYALRAKARFVIIEVNDKEVAGGKREVIDYRG